MELRGWRLGPSLVRTFASHSVAQLGMDILGFRFKSLRPFRFVVWNVERVHVMSRVNGVPGTIA